MAWQRLTLLLLTACATAPPPTLPRPQPASEPKCVLDAELPALAALQPRFASLAERSRAVTRDVFDGGTEVYRYPIAERARDRVSGEAIALVRAARPDYAELLRSKRDARLVLRSLLDPLPEQGIARLSAGPLQAQLDREISDVTFLLELVDSRRDDEAAAEHFYRNFRSTRHVDVLDVLTRCQEPDGYGNTSAACPYLPRLGRFGTGVDPARAPGPEVWRSACVRALFDPGPNAAGDTSLWGQLVQDLELDEALQLAAAVVSAEPQGGNISKLNFWSQPSLDYDLASRTVTERSFCRNDFAPHLGTNRDGMPNWVTDCEAEALTAAERAAWVRTLLASLKHH